MYKNRPFLLAHLCVCCFTLRGHYYSLWGAPFVGGMAGWSPTNNIQSLIKRYWGRYMCLLELRALFLSSKMVPASLDLRGTSVILKAMGTKLCISHMDWHYLVQSYEYRNLPSLGNDLVSELQACASTFICKL